MCCASRRPGIGDAAAVFAARKRANGSRSALALAGDRCQPRGNVSRDNVGVHAANRWVLRTGANSMKFSLVTNASAADLNRMRVMPPHWLDVFGDRIAELVVVLDRRAPQGRIAEQNRMTLAPPHDQRLAEVEAELRRLSERDPRVRIAEIPSGHVKHQLIKHWFGNARLNLDRCQGGTPILAFIAAFAAARERLVLRLDCDMLLHENGWLSEGAHLLASGQADLVEPPRCGGAGATPPRVTTRALMLDAVQWRERVLPIVPHRLDMLRRLHRKASGRPSWLALEQMLQLERERGRLRYHVLGAHLGCWMHVVRNDEAGLPVMPSIAAAMAAGDIPDTQFARGWDFDASAWQMSVRGAEAGQALSHQTMTPRPDEA